ncbi:hypothetical protein MSG28_015955 [Choristoneura fumiferana]|uniref:Uncharacterized protein n=1 Tax=Choristoneura fumiferana TaxID=7141 RepID=A0ACC0K4W4_CHOFU|nr:hypothetical protein MSG28_015955 [Choristoneura fumiferana]
MIVRKLVVLLSFTGYFTATNCLYLNFAAPKSKALESIHNTQDHSARNLDKLIRKGRHHHKKLVILDRKNKKVDDFVKQLLSVIEMNKGDKLLNEDHTLDLDRHKMNCHMSFGSIYNAKAKRKRCKKLHPVFKRKQPWINFVIPIPVKNNIFSETMRQGFSEDYLMDFNRRADIDFDYYNTAHRAQDSTFKHDKETTDFKSRTQGEVAAKKAEDVDAPPKSLRRDHTRFKIVSNENSGELNGKRPEKSPARSGESGSDGTDNTEDDEDKYKKNSDSDSDGNSDDRNIKRPMKKIKDEWNDIIKMPDKVPDSSEESSPPKKHKRIKNSSETNSDNDDRDSDASTTEDFDRKQYKNYDNEKYVYMQGNIVCTRRARAQLALLVLLSKRRPPAPRKRQPA